MIGVCSRDMSQGVPREVGLERGTLVPQSLLTRSFSGKKTELRNHVLKKKT